MSGALGGRKMTNHLLKVEKACMKFGGLKAIDQLSFSIEQGSLSGLIGPNGAGKTTAFNILTGVYKPTQGEVFFDGKNITGLKPYEISQKGMTRTFQNIRLFKNLTVLENVLIAHDQAVKYGMLDILLQTPRFLKSEAESVEYAKNLLRVFGLEDRHENSASSLPYGDQRKLEIVRALATKPQLILLDEPAAGMNHAETETLMKTLQHVRQQFKTTILLIEHDMKLVMGICEKIVVLDHGEKIAEGRPEEIRKSERVIEAYLGKESEA